VPKATHIPERTCIACGSKYPKRQMIRLVRDHDGNITVDQTGKTHGRGCYVCNSLECWEKDNLPHNLSKGLRVPVSQSTKESLTRAVCQNLLTNEPKD
jgi:predicted RNA-binding protein YlxR (DUF448 family)